MARSRRYKKKNPWIQHALLALAATSLLAVGGFLLLREPSAESLFGRGSEALDRGDYSVALEYFNQAIAKNPDQAKFYEGRAKANVSLERFALALENYQQLRQMVQSEPRYVEAIGWIHLDAGDFDKSLAIFNEGARQFPELAESFQSYRGHVHYEVAMEQFTKAERALIQGIFAGKDPQRALDALHDVVFDLEDRTAIEDDFLVTLPDGLLQEQLSEIVQWVEEAHRHFVLADKTLAGFYYSSSFDRKTGEIRASIDFLAKRYAEAKFTCDLLLGLNIPPSRKLLATRVDVFQKIGRADLAVKDSDRIQKMLKQAPQPRSRRIQLQERLVARDFKFVQNMTQQATRIRPANVWNAHLFIEASLGLDDAEAAAEVARESGKYLLRGALSQWAPEYDDRMRVLWAFVRGYSSGQDWEDAVTVLGLILGLSPNNRDALLERAMIQRKHLSNPSRAMQDYFAVMALGERQPDIVEAWESASQTSMKRSSQGGESELDQSIERWEQYRNRKENPLLEGKDPLPGMITRIENQPFIMFALANHFLAQGDASEATILFEKLVRRNPDIDEFRFRYALINASQGRHDTAREQLQSLFKENPSDRAVATALAESLRHLGIDSEARRIESELAKASPDLDGRFFSIRRYFERGEIELAWDALGPLLKVSPMDPDALALKAKVLLARGDEPRARAAVILTLSLNPFHAEATKILVQLAKSADRESEVTPMIDTLANAPFDLDVTELSEIANAINDAGFHQTALEYLEAARERFPTGEPLNLSLAKVKIAMGELEVAQELLRSLSQDQPEVLRLRTLVSVASGGLEAGFRPLTEMGKDMRVRLGLSPFRAAALASIGQIREARRELHRAGDDWILETGLTDLRLLTEAILKVLPPADLEEDVEDGGPLTPIPEGRRRDLDALINIGLQDLEKLQEIANSVTLSLLMAKSPQLSELSVSIAIDAYALAPHCGITARFLARRLLDSPWQQSTIKKLVESDVIPADRVAQFQSSADAALHLLIEQLAGDPNDPNTLDAYTNLVVKQRHTADELLKASEQIFDSSGPSVAAGLLAARAQVLRGETDEAQSTLLTLASRAPGEVSLFIELGELYERQNRVTDARKTYVTALKINPESIRLQEALARLLDLHPEISGEGINSLFPLLRRSPYQFRLYPLVIRDLRGQNGPKITQQLFEWIEPLTRGAIRSEEPNQAMVTAMIAVGESLAEHGLYKRAVALLERAENLDPLSPTALKNLGIAYEAVNRFKDAEACLTLYDKAYGAESEVLTVLAETLIQRLGKPEKAQELAKESLLRGITPAPQVLEILAEWDALNNRFQNAAVTLDLLDRVRQTVLDLDPDQNDPRRLSLHLRIGIWSMLGRDFAGAIKSLSRVRDAFPAHPAKEQAELLIQHCFARARNIPPQRARAMIQARKKLGRDHLMSLSLLPDRKDPKWRRGMSRSVLGPWPGSLHTPLVWERSSGPPVPIKYVIESQNYGVPLGPFPLRIQESYEVPQEPPDLPLGPRLKSGTTL